MSGALERVGGMGEGMAGWEVAKSTVRTSLKQP